MNDFQRISTGLHLFPGFYSLASSNLRDSKLIFDDGYVRCWDIRNNEFNAWSMKGELISSWEKIFYFCRSNNESKNEYYISMGRFRFNYLGKPVYVGDKKKVNNELEMVYGRSIWGELIIDLFPL